MRPGALRARLGVGAILIGRGADRDGASVASRLRTAQVDEVLAMCVAHNLCCLVKAIFTAGLALAFWQDAPAQLLEEQAWAI